MKVEIKPLSGCMKITLGVLTLGVFPLFYWLNLRNWPKLVDEQGLVTRKGTRIEWSQFTKFKKVITYMRGGQIEHFELSSPKGKIVVAPYRLVNGDQVLDYIWQRLPEQAKQKKE
jgi:hypothetical protein